MKIHPQTMMFSGKKLDSHVKLKDVMQWKISNKILVKDIPMLTSLFFEN